VLFCLISYFVLAVVDEALGLAWASPRGGHHGGLLETLLSLVLFIPSIAVTARRLHDEDTWTVSTPVDPVAQGCRSRAVPG